MIGAIIEPQRLEGWFYQLLTIISAILFYVNIITDIISINIFLTQRTVYKLTWAIMEIILFILPTILYAYNTFRNLIDYLPKEAYIQTAIVLCQITSVIQCIEAVKGSMETTAMLDFKFVHGVYKSIPQTFLKTYIMFTVAMNSNTFNGWVLSSIALSIISITVIFIMRYDRKNGRRMAMAPVSDQPIVVIYVAWLLTLFGMGNDTKSVEYFINFDSYYTSHYVWSYIYHLVSLFSRVTSMSWFLSTIPIESQIVIPFCLLWIRLILLVIIDKDFFNHPRFFNFFKSLALVISDSAWNDVTLNITLNKYYRISIEFLTCCENLIGIIYSGFISSTLANKALQNQNYAVGMFIGIIIAMIIKWFCLFYWLLYIHYPELYAKHYDEETTTTDTSEIHHMSHDSNDNDNDFQLKDAFVWTTNKIKIGIGWKPKRLSRTQI